MNDVDRVKVIIFLKNKRKLYTSAIIERFSLKLPTVLRINTVNHP